MSGFPEIFQRELEQHYKQVENAEGDGCWYQCKHCGHKLYYSRKKPRELAAHTPDSIWKTTEEDEGCPERIGEK